MTERRRASISTGAGTMRRTACAVSRIGACLVGLLVGGTGGPAGAEEPVAGARPYDGPHVVLRGGVVLPGAVAGTVELGGQPFVRIATHFGHVVARPADVVSRDESPPTDGVFHPFEARVRRHWGSVESLKSWEVHRTGGSSWTSAYDEAVERREPLRLRPGDRVRVRGTVQRAVTLAIQAGTLVSLTGEGTEIELPTSGSGATVTLVGGRLLGSMGAELGAQALVVGTPGSRIHLFGPSKFSVETDGKTTRLSLFEGRGRIGAIEVPTGFDATWGDREPSTPLFSKAHGQPPAVVPGLESVEAALRDDMAFVPRGSYLLGADPTRADGAPRGPADPYVCGFVRSGRVELRPYLIDRKEVTIAEYSLVQRPRNDGETLHAARDPAGGRPIPADTDRRPRQEEQERLASRWAALAGKRLPTSSQWEASGRGDDGRLYPWGDSVSSTPPPSGRWTELPDAARTAPHGGADHKMTWTPPFPRPTVDDPTSDVSPFGVEALVSGVPEHIREDIERDGGFGLLGRRRQSQRLARLDVRCYTRGIGDSLLSIALQGEGVAPGFRCVIELESR